MRLMTRFLRRDPVLAVSALLAALSMLLVSPDAQYIAYIDTRVLLLLFALMGVVAGLRTLGALNRVCLSLSRHTRTTRGLTLRLTLAAFVLASVVTNDVALIALVPLTVVMMQTASADCLIIAVVMESIAANLGSMATPIGNPQNLYLFTKANMGMGEFLGALWPLCLLSLMLCVALCLTVRAEPLPVLDSPDKDTSQALPRARLLALAGLLVLCLLSVLRVMNAYIPAGLVAAYLLCLDRKAFRQIDFGLLLTFLCFFLLVGNLSRLEAVRAFLQPLMAGHELECGILVSQAISNVPAAVMLSGFTEHTSALLRGVNIGGLGTLVASLASLIAFRLYKKAPGASTGRYLFIFTWRGCLCLSVLYLAAKLLD